MNLRRDNGSDYTSPPDLSFNPDSCLRKGLTFTTKQTIPSLSLNLLGCWWCEPNLGDTNCWFKRPILCLRRKNTSRPPYDVEEVGGNEPDEFYQGWSGGEVEITPPIRGCFIFSREAANVLCEWYFGKGFVMASFDDGRWIENMDGERLSGEEWEEFGGRLRKGGWNFYAKGELEVNFGVDRYWVDAKNGSGNCWD